MEAQSSRWDRQQLDVVGVLEIQPEFSYDAGVLDRTDFRDLIGAADAEHPWKTLTD